MNSKNVQTPDRELQIDDPDKELHARHAQAIQDAQQQVSNVKFRAAEYSDRLRNLAVYNAVQELCVKAEPLFHKTQVGKKYWENTHVDSFRVHPPENAKRQQQADAHNVPVDMPSAQLQPKRVSIGSLAEFVDINPTYEFQFVYGTFVGSRVDPNVFEKTTVIPQRTSTKAQRYCNRYLDYIGLGIKLDSEDEDRSDIDGKDTPHPMTQAKPNDE